jgi:hypothetical protein
VVGDCNGGGRLVEVVSQLGTSTNEVSSFITVESLPVHRVRSWPLSGLLPLYILTSRVSSLESIEVLDELALWGLIALHCGLRSLLELRSTMLLQRMLDRFDRWCTYPVPRVATTLTLVLFLMLALHDTTMVF